MMGWKPRYIVSKAEGVGGEPIPDDEPCLVIRAQDVLARAAMVDYITRYKDSGNADPQVLADLDAHLAELARWRAENVERVKWADR